VSPTNAPLIEAEPESSRLPTLLWLAWRFLPPLDRRDRQVLGYIALACGYLAVPVTIGLAADRVSGLTLLSLLCLSTPALPLWWWSAVPLGERRRETALTLRQARINTRSAATTSASRQLAYPALGAILGTVLILCLHRPLADALPRNAPLETALRHSEGHWLSAAAIAVVVLVALTAVLSSARSARLYVQLGRLTARLDRREAAPQPQ
jgi:hypothetical protein